MPAVQRVPFGTCTVLALAWGHPTPCTVTPLLSLRRLAALSLLAMALPAAAQTTIPPAAVDAAVAHVRARAATLGLSPADVADLVVSDGHIGASGVTYVYLRQRLDGLDVTGTQVSVAIGPDGRVGHVAGSLAPSLAASAGLRRTSALGADGALQAAAGHLGVALGAVSPLPALRLGEPRVQADGLASPATLREVYHRAPDGTLARAWEVSLDARGQTDWWLITVDAATGAELDRQSLTVHEPAHPRPEDAASAWPLPVAVPSPFAAAAFAAGARVGTYRVYPMPVENPTFSPTPPPGDGREVVTDPDNALASPYGWHDTDGTAGAEFTTTQGNNVHAYTDVDANNSPDAGSSPDGGASLVFDFPVDFTLPPSGYRPAAVTNLFYWNNIIHDVLYQYGFDEASGNFQVSNYGRGGVGGDDVRAEGQDGSGTNNANFSTPGEGSRPRMQMYLGTNHPIDVDGQFNNSTITHEYGHGVSIRLTGGPTNVGCLSTNTYPEQMGEGWSDFFALMLTARATDTPEQPRAYGAWFYSNPNGIRPAPYSTDFAVNNLTYQRTRSGVSVPHGVGSIWAMTLWEVTWEMINAHGFSPDLYDANGTAGNQMMLRLVMEGLKLQPCGPGFVDGRDAILAADALLYPDPANPGRGLHYVTLWTGFARRGLGASASQGSSGSNADNTEAFDFPLPAPVLGLTATSIEGAANPGASTTVPLTVENTAPAGHAPLNLTASVLGGFEAQPAPPQAEAALPGRLSVLPAAAGAKGADAPVPSAASQTAGTGGPDAFGHVWVDSDEPGGPTYDWVDISTTGTAVTLSDDATVNVTLPFAFPFYGTAHSSFRLSSNGFLLFGTGGTGTNAGASNGPIPGASDPSNLIAPFWDDLNPADGGQIRYLDMGDGRFVVSWLGVPRYGEAGSAMTFQAILYASGEIVYQYQTITGTDNSATIGIESAGGADGLQIAFGETYAAANLAVRISQPTIWATVSPATATVQPGSSDTFTVTLDATELAPGTYTATLRITSNDPDAATVDLPITFVVDGTVATDPTTEAAVFALEDAAPNPTRGTARIRFSLPEAQAVRLSVTDLLGREVAVLLDGDAPAGASEATLPASLPAGVYLVRIATATDAATRRVTVVR